MKAEKLAQEKQRKEAEQKVATAAKKKADDVVKR